MFKKYKEKFIGDREFYANLIRLIIPMIVQQGITSFVSLLDNVMVGRLGTESMSGVAIVNQLLFVFNLTIFGGLAWARPFSARSSTARVTTRACAMRCASSSFSAF